MKAFLIKMRDELDVAIKQAMKANQEELRQHKEELDLIHSMGPTVFNDPFAISLVEDAIADAKATMADADKLAHAAAIVAKYK